MDDLEFVRKAVTGDRQIWDEFIDKYSRLIYNYILTVLNSKGFSSAQEHLDDIFQEIFCMLVKDDFKKLKSFKARNGSSLASWLRQVTINFTLDFLRSFKPTVSIENEGGKDSGLKDALIGESPAASESLISKEKSAQLRECIRKLPTDDKFFIELHINKNKSLEQLKEVLRVSRGAVDMQKSRIIEKLKECFKNKGFLLDLR